MAKFLVWQSCKQNNTRREISTGILHEKDLRGFSIIDRRMLQESAHLLVNNRVQH